MAETKARSTSSRSSSGKTGSRSSSGRSSTIRSSASRSTSSRSTTSRRTSSPRRTTRGGGEQLTALQSKLGEVIGLAMAAQGATEKVAKMTKHAPLRKTLERMRDEAKETEQRSAEVTRSLNGNRTAIMKKARETKKEATQMMSTYLGRDADELDGFEFLTMAEAAEVGHWAIVETMNKKVKNKELAAVVRWVKPIQKRHYADVMNGSLALAAEEDPNSPA